ALGTDPRLARALLDGAALVGRRTAAEVVALLADDGGPGDVDLTAVLRRRRAQAGRGDTWRREADRWERLLRTTRPAPPHEPVADLDLAVGLVTALAHPDRIARRRTGSEHYLLASGAGARLAGGALAGSEWLAVAEATRSPGQSDAVIRAAAPIDEATAREAGAGLLRTEDDVGWRDGRIVARRVERLGASEPAAETLTRPAPELVTAAVREGLRAEGLGLVPWPAAAVCLRERLAFLHTALGEPWPDVSDEALLARLPEWLGPDLERVRTGRDLTRL